MILQMLSVYDTKVASWMPPFFNNTLGAAIRSFGDTVADPNTLLNKHAEDFTLFHLGVFNDQDGTFALLDAPISLGHAIEYFKDPSP